MNFSEEFLISKVDLKGNMTYLEFLRDETPTLITPGPHHHAS